MLSLYSRKAQLGKRRAAAFLPAGFASLLLLLPAAAQTASQITIARASRIVFTHTGVHTHANYLLFDTGALNLLTMQRDPARYPHLAFRAHCSLPTDRAALPPDLAAFRSPGDPPLENPYGPVDGGGKPGWTELPLHQNGRNWVKVLAPTRFANWLAQQSPARRKQYLMPKRYTLKITWGG